MSSNDFLMLKLITELILHMKMSVEVKINDKRGKRV